MIGFIPANQRVLNVLVTTPPFIFASTLVATAMGEVVQWIIGAESNPAQSSTPASYRTVPNVFGSIDDATATVVQTDEKVSSVIVPDGQADGVDLQEFVKLENKVTLAEEGHGMSPMVSRIVVSAVGDLRVRVAFILLAMAVMNWVSLFFL